MKGGISPEHVNSDWKLMASEHALEMDVLSLKKHLWHICMYCINDIHHGLHLPMMLFNSMIFFFLIFKWRSFQTIEKQKGPLH